jgi:hypothetical protein
VASAGIPVNLMKSLKRIAEAPGVSGLLEEYSKKGKP